LSVKKEPYLLDKGVRKMASIFERRFIRKQGRKRISLPLRTTLLLRREENNSELPSKMGGVEIPSIGEKGGKFSEVYLTLSREDVYSGGGIFITAGNYQISHFSPLKGPWKLLRSDLEL